MLDPVLKLACFEFMSRLLEVKSEYLYGCGRMQQICEVIKV